MVLRTLWNRETAVVSLGIFDTQLGIVEEGGWTVGEEEQVGLDLQEE